MTSEDDGRNRPAFPVPEVAIQPPGTKYKYDPRCDGLSAREYACILLQVDDSGTPWLDDLIRKARRMELAGQAMQGIIQRVTSATMPDLRVANWAYQLADAMLAEEQKSQAAPE